MQKYLVTGGSGKFSRKVIEILLNDLKIDAKDIITTTRDKSKLEDFSKLGIDVREANFDDKKSLREAFKGATKLLLVSTNEIGKRVAQHTNAIEISAELGVKHLVYTSMPNPYTSPITFASEHDKSEKAIENSQIPSYNILRNNWYFENLIELEADIFKTGHWLNSNKDGKISNISRDDLAYGAAISLVKNENEKKIYNLAGNEALSLEQMVETIKEVTSKELKLNYLELDELESTLESFSLPKDLVEMIVSFENHNKKDLSNISGEDFENLTNKKAKSFKAWVEENKETILNIK